MKTIIIFCVLWLMTTRILFGVEQPKNVVGISAGIVPAMSEMYFGLPWDISPQRELSPVYQLFYARQVHSAIRIGAYFEYEKVKFTAVPDPVVHSFKRQNIGINVLGQFPKTPLHMQLGGYLGYGSLTADHWNKLTGVDFGFIAGPAFEKDHYGISIHVQSGYAGYNSSGTPAEVKLYNPKIMFKFYYRF